MKDVRFAAPVPVACPPASHPCRAKGGTNDRRRAGRIDVQAAIEGEDEKVRSLASVRRQRERERRQAELDRLRSDQVKVVRDVILPDRSRSRNWPPVWPRARRTSSRR